MWQPATMAAILLTIYKESIFNSGIKHYGLGRLYASKEFDFLPQDLVKF